MASETIDYTAVLADLEAKKAGLEAAITAVRQLLNLGAEDSSNAPGASTTNAPRLGQPTAVRFDSFFGLNIPDGIIKFLEMSKQPQSVSEITTALEAGGLKSNAKKLMASVGSTLSRMKRAGDVVSVKKKWGLATWYPRAPKQSATEKSQKGRKRARPRGSKPKKTETKSEATKAEQPKPGSSKLTPEQIALIKALHAAGKKPGEIGKQVGIHHFTVLKVLRQKKTA